VQMKQMVDDVNAKLAEKYGFASPDIAVDPIKGFVKKEASLPPLPQLDE